MQHMRVQTSNLGAGSLTNVAHGIVMRAAAIVIVAARCVRQRATPPIIAHIAPRVYTATSVPRRARVRFITDIRR